MSTIKPSDFDFPHFEPPQQDLPLSAQEQKIWRSAIKTAALRSLQAMEAFYLSEEEQENRKDAPLTSARYNEWLAWMKKIDADPSAPFEHRYFVDEGLLAESIKIFMNAMEALEELRATQRLSWATKEGLDLDISGHFVFNFGDRPVHPSRDGWVGGAWNGNSRFIFVRK